MNFLYGILPDGRFLHGILLVIFPKKEIFFALNSTLVTMLKKEFLLRIIVSKKMTHETAWNFYHEVKLKLTLSQNASINPPSNGSSN